MTEQELKKHRDDIDKLTQEEAARLFRFAPLNHVWFITKPLYEHFDKRFKSLGGMTPELSKKIGW